MDQFGVTETLRKYHLSPKNYRRWKDNFNEGDVANLQSYARQRNPEMEALEEQIKVLKNIIDKQQFELEFKTEPLKKSISRLKSVAIMLYFYTHSIFSKLDI